MIHTTIINGSHRKDSQSLKISRFIEYFLKTFYPKEDQISFLSLAENPIPLWDESMWDKGSDLRKLWKPTAEILQSAHAFVIVTPEWGGMVPAGLKNFFLYCSHNELGHKPGLIVSLSSGMGGAYPVAELRMSSYKNTRFCYIPEHIIVRYVEKYFNDFQKAQAPEEEDIRKRLTYALNLLREYALALNQVRASGVINHNNFPNGV